MAYILTSAGGGKYPSHHVNKWHRKDDCLSTCPVLANTCKAETRRESNKLGLLLGAIRPSFKLSSNQAFKVESSFADNGRNGRKGGVVPGSRSIAWSAALRGGNALTSTYSTSSETPWSSSGRSLVSSAQSWCYVIIISNGVRITSAGSPSTVVQSR
jgi:hypothetical protein